LVYRGSYQSVRDYLVPYRDAGAAPPATPKPPKVRDLTRWIVTRPQNLEADDHQALNNAMADRLHLDALAGHVRAFAEMTLGRHGDRLKSDGPSRRRRPAPPALLHRRAPP
jgi:hypothetical protein